MAILRTSFSQFKASISDLVVEETLSYFFDIDWYLSILSKVRIVFISYHIWSEALEAYGYRSWILCLMDKMQDYTISWYTDEW